LHAVGGDTFTWDNSIGSGQTHSVSPSLTTEYVVTAANLNLCENTDTVIITVNPLPPANAGPDQEICYGETATIIASGGDSYAWCSSRVLLSVDWLFQLVGGSLTDFFQAAP